MKTDTLRRSIFRFACLTTLLLGVACAKNRENLSPFPTIDPKVKANLDAPVNCQSASSQIQILEDEKASIGKQILAGVRSVLPVAVVAGILMGDYNDRFEVAIGQYNSDIDVKIAQIRGVCGVK